MEEDGGANGIEARGGSSGGSATAMTRRRRRVATAAAGVPHGGGGLTQGAVRVPIPNRRPFIGRQRHRAGPAEHAWAAWPAGLRARPIGGPGRAWWPGGPVKRLAAASDCLFLLFF